MYFLIALKLKLYFPFNTLNCVTQLWAFPTDFIHYNTLVDCPEVYFFAANINNQFIICLALQKNSVFRQLFVFEVPDG